ncbi:MAG: dockerin type I domain-containing protein, partial [Tepidisphaeraceae bacterium]
SISLSQTGDAGVTINNDVQLAAGALNVLNGTHTLNGALIVSNNGSTFNVAGDLTLNGALGGSANLTKTGAGTFRITQPGLNTGVVTISNGTLQVSNADGGATGTGGLTIAKGAFLTGDGSIAAPTTVAGTLAPAKIASSASQLHFSAPLTLQSGATVQLDLSVAGNDSLQSTSSVLLNGALSLSVAGALPDLTPISLITGNAVSGVFSTVNGVVLAGDPGRALAVTYSPTAVILVQTLGGDLNLDGKVDYADLLLMVQDAGHVNASWTTGDVTGDGLTNSADLTSLRMNYGRSTSGAAVSVNDFNVDYARATGVPEPSWIAGGFLVGVLARRRRARHVTTKTNLEER